MEMCRHVDNGIQIDRLYKLVESTHKIKKRLGTVLLELLICSLITKLMTKTLKKNIAQVDKVKRKGLLINKVILT